MKNMSQKKILKMLKKITMSEKEFRKGAEKSSLFKDVTIEMMSTDEVDNKINRDWNILANQSVINPIY